MSRVFNKKCETPEKSAEIFPDLFANSAATNSSRAIPPAGEFAVLSSKSSVRSGSSTASSPSARSTQLLAPGTSTFGRRMPTTAGGSTPIAQNRNVSLRPRAAMGATEMQPLLLLHPLSCCKRRIDRLLSNGLVEQGIGVSMRRSRERSNRLHCQRENFAERGVFRHSLRAGPFQLSRRALALPYPPSPTA